MGTVDKLLVEFEKSVLPTEKAGRAFVDSFLKKVTSFPSFNGCV